MTIQIVGRVLQLAIIVKSITDKKLFFLDFGFFSLLLSCTEATRQGNNEGKIKK